MTVDLLTQVRAAGLPAPVTEHRFHPVRRWRFDFAWPDEHLALEIAVGSTSEVVTPAGPPTSATERKMPRP